MCIRITFVFVGCNKGKVGPALSTSHQNPPLVTPDNLRVSETYRCECDATQREYIFISTAGDNPPWDTNSLLAGAGI